MPTENNTETTATVATPRYGQHSLDPEKPMMQRMLDGELYLYNVPELLQELAACEAWLSRFNASLALPLEQREAILRERIGHMGEGCAIRPPFYSDYGTNIHMGHKVYLNYNCYFLDVCRIDIGDGTLIGPGVQVYTADHPRDRKTREAGWEFGKPIRIGKNVWIGGAAIILPGVSIGDHAIVGAGSVVTKDVPANCTVVGSPARIVKQNND